MTHPLVAETEARSLRLLKLAADYPEMANQVTIALEVLTAMANMEQRLSQYQWAVVGVLAEMQGVSRESVASKFRIYDPESPSPPPTA